VTVYGLADSRLVGGALGAVIELYVRREDAERALEDVLTDEPHLEGVVSVVPVLLSA
jgi:hypothetical protein